MFKKIIENRSLSRTQTLNPGCSVFGLRAALIFAIAVNFATSAFYQAQAFAGNKSQPEYKLNDNQISIYQMIEQLKDNKEDQEALRQLLLGRLKTMGVPNLPEENLNEKIKAFVDEVSARGETSTPRFPILPLDSFLYLNEEILDQKGAKNPTAISLQQSFNSIFSDECPTTDSALKDLDVNFKTGHVSNTDLSQCQKHQSTMLAKILTALALGQGQSEPIHARHENQKLPTTQNSKTVVLRDITEFFDFLIASGHVVTLKLEKTYADFIALNYKEQSVIWPVWTDTGVKTKEGQNLLIPVGHSHWSWQIRGPKIKADVLFYLGVDGAAFYSRTTMRPRWTGWSQKTIADTEHDREKVQYALQLAEGYLLRNRAEASHLMNNGYGYVGVCNDSTGLLEMALNLKLGLKSVSVFPLVRNTKIKNSFKNIGDAFDTTLNAALQALPSDLPTVEHTGQDLNEIQQRERLKRIFDMIPATSGHLADPKAKKNSVGPDIELLNDLKSAGEAHEMRFN